MNNKIIVSIEKETSDEKCSLTMLQLLSSGEAFQKVIKVTYGDEKNAKIRTKRKRKFYKFKEKRIITFIKYSNRIN